MGTWHTILPKLSNEEAAKLWSVTDLEPNTEPEILAEELATHFTNITNESELNTSEIPISMVPNILIPQLLEQDVSKRIQNYKKPSSTVKGDIQRP